MLPGSSWDAFRVSAETLFENRDATASLVPNILRNFCAPGGWWGFEGPGCSSPVRGPACWIAVPFTLWNQFFIFLRRLVRDLPKVSRGELNCCKFGGRLPPEISVAFWMSWATVSKTAALACLVGATLYEM